MSKKVYTARDLETLWKETKSFDTIPSNAVLTPSAKDFMRDHGGKAPQNTVRSAATGGSTYQEPVIPDFEYKWIPGQDAQTQDAINALYQSPEITAIREKMCEMGQRMWQKNYVDGNGGNITVRIGDNLALCTPTLISKGFMKPEDICIVDLDGNQKAGWRKRTSEAMTHFGIMKRQPSAKACVHAHPPHGTAFAVAGIKPPTCLIPEAEVFLGQIGLAPYQTPGSPENADTVGETGVTHQAVLMENHGVICWGKDVEDAYWKMENVEAYLQTVILTSMLGKNPGQGYGPKKLKEIIGIRKQLGMDDYRDDWEECQLCDNSDFQPGFFARNEQSQGGCAVPSSNGSPNNDQAEAIVKQVTDKILEKLN